MFPAARITDPITHDQVVPCGIIGPPVPPPGPLTIFIEGLPAAFVTCTVVCTGVISGGLAHPPLPPPPAGPPNIIVKGSLTVFFYMLPAARWVLAPDLGTCGVFLGDAKLTPMRVTFIGDAG